MNSPDNELDRKDVLPMLANHPLNPTLPATNLERARRFYAEKLGLFAESEMSGFIIGDCKH